MYIRIERIPPNHTTIFKVRLNLYMYCKITLCVVKKGRILSETKAKCMTVYFLKHVENDLYMLS